MTGSQIAAHFNAKKIGKSKWLAKCPAHPDRKPSLSIDEGRRGVVLFCQSHQCDVRDIVAGAGLRMKDLFYHSRDLSSEALQIHIKKQQQERAYEAEKRRQDLKMMLHAIELKPYQRVKRCQSHFERDIETMCSRLEKTLCLKH